MLYFKKLFSQDHQNILPSNKNTPAKFLIIAGVLLTFVHY